MNGKPFFTEQELSRCASEALARKDKWFLLLPSSPTALKLLNNVKAQYGNAPRSEFEAVGVDDVPGLRCFVMASKAGCGRAKLQRIVSAFVPGFVLRDDQDVLCISESDEAERIALTWFQRLINGAASSDLAIAA
jgi:hypothetical protein